jgi:glycogen operon protein
MILAGDEVRRTQGGNNNAYNQDNPTNWIDWSLETTHRDMLRYFTHVIAFRKAHPALSRPFFYTGAISERGLTDIIWHGTKLNSPGFENPDARALACTIAGFGGARDLHVMINMYWEALVFDVPAIPGRQWRVAIDTFAASPHDIASPGRERPFAGTACTVQGRSIVVLVGA